MAGLNSTGAEALRRANVIMRSAGPITGLSNIGQSYDIQPGWYDREQQILIVGQYSGEAWYLRQNGLYSLPLGQFIHGYQIGQVAGQVYRETRWIIPAAQAEMAFCMGIAAGVAGVVALIASVTVVGLKVAVFYNSHKQQIDSAIRQMDVALRTLQWLRQNCPVTHRQMGSLLQRALWEALVSVPEGITAADVAAVVGRLFGGLANAPEAGLGPLLRVLAGGLSTAAVRLPAMAARGGVARASAAADQFIQQLRANGGSVSQADINAIRREFHQHPEVEQKLRELHQALRESAPVLQALAQAFRVEAMPEIQGQGATGAAR